MSRFILSFAVFLLINLAVKALPYQLSSSQNPNQEHTWTEWALNDFDKQKERTNSIVFLGSSLMLTPIDMADARFLNCRIDGAEHHNSALFQNLLSQKTKIPTANFNFALPGLMPSDAYLITRKLLNSGSQPQLIVYGLGPRDFLDNLLPSAISTDTFHCLSQSLPQAVLSEFINHDWQQKFSCFCKQYLPLLYQKNNVNNLLTNWTSNMPLPTPVLSMQQIHKFLPSFNPMAIRRGECIFSPSQQIDPNRFAQNLNEYRQRYHQMNWETFTSQTKLFLDLLKMASTNNTKVLIVSMPITSVNRQLLPDYIYTTYKTNLRVISQSCGAYFIDLDGKSCFSDQDFLDTVHLNASGGDKLLRLIAQYITEHNILDQKINDHPRLAQTGIKI